MQPPDDNGLSPPPDSDVSLLDLLAPLVAERLQRTGGLAPPPQPLEISDAFAAISVVTVPRGDTSGAVPGACASHFVQACSSLATHGFRRCSLVVDKLGVSVRCLEGHGSQGHPAEQVDFPWSSVSDVQDPRLRTGLQGCTLALGVREPARLFGGPAGALTLVLRLPNGSTAGRLADAALAFKAYEAQTALRSRGQAAASPALAALLLDECGSAFWSLTGDEEQEAAGADAAKVNMEPCGPVMEGGPLEPPCCSLCWC